MLSVKITRLREGSNPLPQYQSPHAAGMDLQADLNQPLLLEPGQRRLIPTGLAIELPHGYEAQIRPRSGLAIKQGITCVNSPGTIDSDYRGEIQVALINLGNESVKINHGDRIAQMIVAPVIRIKWEEGEELGSTERGAGGFGSTGK